MADELTLEDELEELNSTDVFKIRVSLDECKLIHEAETARMERDHPEGFCNASSDTLMCWPPTALNQTRFVQCFKELNTIKYDDTQNASRHCLWNGTWEKSNYSTCTEIMPFTPNVETQETIYQVGYTLSLITLLIAIGIFTYFKELRCIRNTIHMNLMCSLMLMYCMWILTQSTLNIAGTSVICIFIVTLLNYFHTTTFFWMFVEGLYLYTLVVETLTRDTSKLRVYLCIGWGLPLLFIIIWVIVKGVVPVKGDTTCAWFESRHIDWIYEGPTVVILLLNLLFLMRIMWVLITKLRSATSDEDQQYHKAAKALLVLMPLLGITYVITLYAPANSSSYIFESVRAVLLSTQGFTVALFYCFLNTEVQNTVRKHFDSWKTNRSLGSRPRKDWSPRSRTESIRLYSQPASLYHKRESCTSEVTTTTLVTVNGGTTRPATNGGAQARSPFLHPPRPSYGGNV